MSASNKRASAVLGAGERWAAVIGRRSAGAGRLRDSPATTPDPERARSPRHRARLEARRWPRAPSAGAGAPPRPRRRQAAARAGRLELGDLAGCDLVIEAAPEDVELKRELFAAAGRGLRPGRDPRDQHLLAAGHRDRRRDVPNPERVVGMHFFNPPALMKLVEVVRREPIRRGALGRRPPRSRARMGRTPIRAKDSPGFIANRLARPFTLESLRMLGDGARRRGDDRPRLPPRRRLPDGPVRADRPDRARRQPQRRPLLLRPGRRAGALAPQPDPGAAWSREGLLGRKSGEGFYDYGERRAHRERGPRARHRCADRSTPASWPGSTRPAPEILPRLIAQIANEAAFALEEGVGSPADMDTAMRLGFNWPLGPLEFAELIGAGRALALLDKLERQAALPTRLPLAGSAAEQGLSLSQASA